MSAKTIISERTTAVVSFPVNWEGLRGEYNIFATGLAGSETVDIEISQDSGVSGEDAFQDGVQVQLTATNNIMKVNCPIFLRVDKSITAGASGVFAAVPLDTPEAP